MTEHLDATGHYYDRISDCEYACKCGEMLADKTALLQHRGETGCVHVSAKRLVLLAAQYQEEKPKYRCRLCNLRFHSALDFDEHLTERHVRCEQCGEAFRKLDLLNDHKKRQSHCYCAYCKEIFSKPQATDHHNTTTMHATEFRCMDCDQSFKNEAALLHHLKSPKAHMTKQPVASDSEREPEPMPKRKPQPTPKPKQKQKQKPAVAAPKTCKRCLMGFENEQARESHLNSLKHRPISNLRCPLSKEFTKHFRAPSSLVAHLESGACKSGVVDRYQLNKIVGLLDQDHHVITNKDFLQKALAAHTARQEALSELEKASPWLLEDTVDSTISLQTGVRDLARMPDPDAARTLASMPMSTLFSRPDQSSFVEYDAGAETEDEGGVLLPLSHDDSLTTSLIQADTMQALARFQKQGRIICPLCIKVRTFATLSGLYSHLTKVVHGPKLYHYPSIVVGTPGSQDTRYQRKFASLSLLTKHMEVQARAGGQEVFERAMRFVEEKLRALDGNESFKLLLE